MATKKVVTVPSEMFEVISPILRLSRFCGLCPLNWTKSNSCYIITKSRTYAVYSIVILVFLISTSIFGQSQLAQIKIVHDVRLATNARMCVTFGDISVVLIPAVIGVITTILKIDKYAEFLCHLGKADSLLGKHHRKSFTCWFVIVTTILYAAFLLLLDWILWLKETSNHQDVVSVVTLFFYFMPHYICHCFTVMMELVYWQSVYSIKVRIGLIKDNLEDIIKCQNFEIAATPSVIMVNNKKESDRKGYPAINFRRLMKVYENLLEASHLVNDCYGFIIMCVILGCLMHLLVTPYDLYDMLLHTGKTVFIIIQVLWMLGHILRFLLIVEPCHGCLNESSNLSAMIYKLTYFDWNKETKNDLEILLMYLSQCKIKFTAFDLVKIQRSLFTTMSGAVTTYLVILFQFRQ